MNKSFLNLAKSIMLIIISIVGTSSFVKGESQNVINFKFKSNDAVVSTYKSFSLITNNSSVNLSWTTDTTTSQDYFEVERSFDNKNFTTAGLVLGPKETNDLCNKYGFKDAIQSVTEHLIIYYRLKQISANGTFIYSAVKTIVLNDTTNMSGLSGRVL